MGPWFLAKFGLNAAFLILLAALYFRFPARTTAGGDTDVPSRVIGADSQLLPGGISSATPTRTRLLAWLARFVFLISVFVDFGDVLLGSPP